MAQARHSFDTMHGYDTPLLLSVMFLSCIGVVMIYSASSAIANNIYGNGFYFLKKQALSAGLGIFVLVTASMIPYRVYRSFAYLFLAFSAILLLVTQIHGIGHTAGGATRWIRIAGFSIQPSEFARLSMVIYLAYSLSKKQEFIEDFTIGFVPHVVVLMFLAVLIMLQPDFGSVVILAALTWIMMFVAGVPVKFLSLSLVPALPLACYVMMSASYRVQRLMSFLDPWKYQKEEGYQIVHSLMAFGTGGLWGKGLGNGYQKLFYLPEPHTDFIFSVIGEELGLCGVLVILCVFALVIWRGIIIARQTKDHFGSFLATGITTCLALQACINMGVAMGLLPTKGLALPFLSYGGSSLLINMAAVGILINIGKTNHYEKE